MLVVGRPGPRREPVLWGTLELAPCSGYGTREPRRQNEEHHLLGCPRPGTAVASSQDRPATPVASGPRRDETCRRGTEYCPIGHCRNRGGTMKNHRLARLIGVVALGVSGFGGAGVLIPSLGETGVAGALPPCSAAGTTGLTARTIATPNQTITGATDATGCDLGIYVGPGVTGVTINNATISGANDHGIFAQDTTGLTVSNSTVQGNGVAPTAGIAENKGIELVGVSDSTVSGKTVTGNLADGGIGVADDGPVDPGAPNPGTLTPTANVTVTNNQSNGNFGGCGVVIAAYDPGAGVTSATVTNNTVIGTVGQFGPHGPVIGGIVVAADTPATSVSSVNV